MTGNTPAVLARAARAATAAGIPTLTVDMSALAIWLHVTREGTVDFGGTLARDRLPGVLRQIADRLDATPPPGP